MGGDPVSHYLIIDLIASRAEDKLILWGNGCQNTADINNALIVNEHYVNQALDRYDNGTTTLAVLVDAARNFTGHWRALVAMPMPCNTQNAVQKGEAA
jgi:hypothetical protein